MKEEQNKQKPEGDKGRMNNMEKNERFSEKAHEALPLVLTVLWLLNAAASALGGAMS